MDSIEHIDEKGRRYRAYADQSGNIIILGPPEGLVDSLNLPEPFATTLHNVLYARGILNYDAAVRAGNALMGALQEALVLDVQRLTEAFYKIEKV